MAKASDILNKAGASGKPASGQPETILEKLAAGGGEESDAGKKDGAGAKKPDRGFDLRAPAKPLGGGGGSAGRPKV